MAKKDISKADYPQSNNVRAEELKAWGGCCIARRLANDTELNRKPFAKLVFIDLILEAVYTPQTVAGVPLKRGQRLTTYHEMGDRYRLSYQEIRTIISYLKALKYIQVDLVKPSQTLEISTTQRSAQKSTYHLQRITVVNYDYWNGTGEKINRPATDQQQHKYKDNKDNKKERERTAEQPLLLSLEVIERICKEQGLDKLDKAKQEKFYNYYTNQQPQKAPRTEQGLKDKLAEWNSTEREQPQPQTSTVSPQRNHAGREYSDDFYNSLYKDMSGRELELSNT